MGGRRARKGLLAVIVLAGLLFNTTALAAGMLDAIGDVAVAVAKMTMELVKHRAALYMACAAYRVEFGKWPSRKEDLLAVKDLVAKKGADEETLTQIVEGMEIAFTRLEDGRLLIEGRYGEKMESDLEKTGMGKCRISVIASYAENEIVFAPSNKIKRDKTYFNISAKFSDIKK